MELPIFGIDFTSAPRRSKAITIARGSLTGDALRIDAVERIESFDAFEGFLAQPGPWVGGFDFPFGLPRELVVTLQWPTDWRELMNAVRHLGKVAFKDALNRVRERRPMGARYIERQGDRAAMSSSPMKLVNPPVGLMFFEGAPRLAAAQLSVIPCARNADMRIALEAYPGYLARQLTRQSYKKDGREGNTPARIAARSKIAETLAAHCATRLRLHLNISSELARECIVDGSGDTLDAVLCAVQAASAQRRFAEGDIHYGIPEVADPLEGWIAGVSAQ